jgi:hypothetical protein
MLTSAVLRMVGFCTVRTVAARHQLATVAGESPIRKYPIINTSSSPIDLYQKWW